MVFLEVSLLEASTLDSLATLLLSVDGFYYICVGKKTVFQGNCKCCIPQEVLSLS